MKYLKSDRLKYVFWLIVVVSWIGGFAISRWYGTIDSFVSISYVVRVTNPANLATSWKLFLFFTLSAVSAFVLTHILFGVGGFLFFFARGMYDHILFSYVEETITGWSLASIPFSELKLITIIVLIFCINLPLTLWGGQLGIQRSVYTLNRLRSKPMDPDFGSEPFSKLVVIVILSMIGALVSAIIFSYI